MENRTQDLMQKGLDTHECDLIQALIDIRAIHAETVEFCNCRVCQIARRALTGILAHC